MKKRVCIIRYSFFPHHAHVLRNVDALLESGYEVDVICLKGEGEEKHEYSRGVNIYRLSINRGRSGIFRYVFQYVKFTLLVFWRLTWLSLVRGYKVVELDSPPDFVIFCSIVPKILGAKIILYIFDHVPELFREKYTLGNYSIKVKLLRIIERMSAFWADRVITVNKRCQKLMEDEGVSDSKLSVVLNVPDDSVFINKASTDSREKGFRIMTHGSILYRYGIQTLIRAVPSLVEEIPDISVEVVGDGEYRKCLQELSKSLNIENYVNFAGFIPHEKLPSRIAQAHVGVICILANNEILLPNKLFEYMSLGKPIITTFIPAIADYFNDNSLMFYDPDNEGDLVRCILELYRNPERRMSLAKSSLNNYEKYRWSVMKKQYLKVYEELIKC